MTGSKKRVMLKRKRLSGLDCLTNLQSTHVFQCLVGKHITRYALGPELSVKIAHVMGTKTIV